MTESAASKLPPHRKVRVDLGPRSYDVLIGRGLLLQIQSIFEAYGLKTTRIQIVDFSVRKLEWFSSLAQLNLSQRQNIGYLLPTAAPSGEEAKSIETYGNILRDMATGQVSRHAIIVSVGGGVIGDLAGFVAATYLRGINFVQVPTTLLAMVDSSVGGKTGVNLPEGKNLVGAFHQPKLVVADLDTLATLPAREFAAGMAEVIKYGAIREKALFDRVARGVKPGDDDLDEIVEKCVAIKARIVERDEFETKGERALLNFGHTIGHAIEKATGYTKYLHGEAISLGMRAAAWLSRREAGLSQEDARDLDLALIANQLPVVLDKEVDSQSILAALGNDKKVAADGVNRWVLLTQLGQAESGRVIPPELVAQAVEYLRTHPDDL
jgi:3-dehydroquinate synthase